MNIKDDFILSKINEGYLVGGCIRDWHKGVNGVGVGVNESKGVNGRKPEICDRDIAIKGAEEFARKLAVEFDATFIVLDSVNKIYRLVLKDKTNYLDISELRGECIEEDLTKRDFTINAIAYDLKNNRYIDVTGGIEDLKNGILRHIDDKNFEDDPLRVLRAFRFMAVTGFEFDIKLIEALKKYYPLIEKPAKERVCYELVKLFGGDFASKTLLEMDKIGILELIFPNVNEMKKVPPNSHHHLGLFHHAVETVRQVENLYENSDEEVKEHLQRVDFGGFSRINHLKIAAFLHDLGKFSTWTIEKSGRHRFIKHDSVGAKMVVPLLKNLKFSNKQIEYISEMIKKHIYPSNVIAAPILDEKVMMRYIRKMEDNTIDNIILAKADRLSARGPEITEEVVNENINGLEKLLNFYLKNKSTLQPLPKLLSGNEIMEIKGIKQSPLLGEIIRELQEAQISGNIITKDEAIIFVKNYIK